ncbi:hypothetical protein KDK77_04715 [bacterium]|nr:hypothetical protein [bacterium]MCP5463157.1 hypothetical protein [bacterium]
MWELHVEVVKGARKGEKSSYTVEITQDEDGRVEGKTLDQVNNQVGRLSGLVKRTKIEMTFSADKDKYISDLNISPQGTFIGGIFHRPDGNEGIIYGLKQDAPSLEGTF